MKSANVMSASNRSLTIFKGNFRFVRVLHHGRVTAVLLQQTLSEVVSEISTVTAH